MIIRILDRAENDIKAATDYYNDESPSLGFEFLDEFLKTVDRILLNPKAWQPLSLNSRRAMTRRFPYGVIYRVSVSEILIVAVMHLHRHPNSWKE